MEFIIKLKDVEDVPENWKEDFLKERGVQFKTEDPEKVRMMIVLADGVTDKLKEKYNYCSFEEIIEM